jgi:capsular polysaccharide biosynthesis protein
MELIDYLRMLRRQWLWVVGSVVVLTALAAVYVSVAPKSYRATSDIYILGTVQGDPQNVNDAAQSASKYVFDNIDTFAALVDSPRVTGPVIKDLKLTTTPEQLAKQVTATVMPNTVIITVAASDASPAAAAAVANATATSLSAAIQDLAIPTAQAPLDVTTVKPATPPTAPDSPNRTLWLALGLLLGLALGLVVATLREQLRRTPEVATATVVDEPTELGTTTVVASDVDEPNVDEPKLDEPHRDEVADGERTDGTLVAAKPGERTPATTPAGSSSRPARDRAVTVGPAQPGRTMDPRRSPETTGPSTSNGSNGAASAKPTDPEAAPRDPAPTRR